MADYKTVRLHKSTWLKLKRRALEEGTSLLELVEKLAGASEGRRGGSRLKAEVLPAGTVWERVDESEVVEAMAKRAVELEKGLVGTGKARLSNILRGCKRCGHEAGVHGAFSCVKGCGCGGYVT
jgi:hypothetical protein